MKDITQINEELKLSLYNIEEGDTDCSFYIVELIDGGDMIYSGYHTLKEAYIEAKFYIAKI